ncbi:N-acetylmuramoyl-L-alanine amidase [Microbispora triticiradicis]|uniref:peptidoglycan recognition protein family protein n=1 Tax=Microbispora triticiradicis TaxID=2200763 RepID=UPI001AD6CDAC|nr:N-acetylmuramoyl-L-alanine amidase [Microbispora triticiradicis]MBO4272372.1 N-acetylmuramoyl-L-alanine amidase [Microbispora triticiradicis]
MNLISRAGWKAKAPNGFYTVVSSTRGVKVHYTGGPVPAGIVDDHDLCVQHVRDIQRMHMAGGREVPYMDIGYNMVACPHRKVFMGRGPHHLPAANGPGLNSGHYAVLALVGNKGFTQPNDDLLHAVCDAIDYLRKEGGAGKEVKGHRDGYATDCPGGPLYAWVKKGAPRPDGGASTPEKSWTETLMEDLPLLREGDDKYDVKTARGCMFARGRVPEAVYTNAGLKEWLERTKFDSEFGGLVRDFQRAEKLDVDGLIGKNTWMALHRRASK